MSNDASDWKRAYLDMNAKYIQKCAESRELREHLEHAMSHKKDLINSFSLVLKAVFKSLIERVESLPEASIKQDYIDAIKYEFGERFVKDSQQLND